MREVKATLVSNQEPASDPAAAPLRVVLELWPDVPKARAEITEGGKTREYELKSSLVLSVILNYVKGLK